MIKTLDMQDMRHLNLFEKVTRINTRFCFGYNSTIIFCVPMHLLSKAIGERGKNVKQIHEILEKRIKIIASPRGVQDAKYFIESIVDPLTFKSLEIKDNEIILSAGASNKAALIGRNKRRLLEMQRIVRDFFNREFKII